MKYDNYETCRREIDKIGADELAYYAYYGDFGIDDLEKQRRLADLIGLFAESMANHKILEASERSSVAENEQIQKPFAGKLPLRKPKKDGLKPPPKHEY